MENLYNNVYLQNNNINFTPIKFILDFDTFYTQINDTKKEFINENITIIYFEKDNIQYYSNSDYIKILRTLKKIINNKNVKYFIICTKMKKKYKKFKKIF